MRCDAGGDGCVIRHWSPTTRVARCKIRGAESCLVGSGSESTYGQTFWRFASSLSVSDKVFELLQYWHGWV